MKKRTINELDISLVAMVLMAVITITGAVTSCARVQYVPVERVRTVTQTLRDTVVSVQLERETVAQTVADTTSTVETRYARSVATWHGARAVLEHRITTKEQPIEVQVKYVERRIVDSVPAPYPIYVDKPVDRPVRMPLRWWERMFLYMGIAASGGVAIWVVKKVK